MIFQKKYYFHMFSYKSLVSGDLVLVIIVIAYITSPLNYVTDVIYNFFITYFLMPIILKYIEV